MMVGPITIPSALMLPSGEPARPDGSFDAIWKAQASVIDPQHPAAMPPAPLPLLPLLPQQPGMTTVALSLDLPTSIADAATDDDTDPVTRVNVMADPPVRIDGALLLPVVAPLVPLAPVFPAKARAPDQCARDAEPSIERLVPQGRTRSVALPTDTLSLPTHMPRPFTPDLTPAPTVTGTPPAITRHLDLASGDAWLSSLARDIAATASRDGRLHFALSPEALGRIDVDMRQDAAGLTVRILTSHDAAHDLLTAAIPRIADEIRAQNIAVASAEVLSDSLNGREGGQRHLRQPRAEHSPQVEAARASADAPVISPPRKRPGRYA